MPATPGAPPEVFAEGQDGDAGPPSGGWGDVGGWRGLFYIRIESAAETILTDFFSLSLSFLVAGSLGADVCLPRHETFGSGAVCHPVPSHASTLCYSLIIYIFPKLNSIFFNLEDGIPSSKLYWL